MVKDRIDALEDFRKQLEGADADSLCGADYGERSRAAYGPRQADLMARCGAGEGA